MSKAPEGQITQNTQLNQYNTNYNQQQNFNNQVNQMQQNQSPNRKQKKQKEQQQNKNNIKIENLDKQIMPIQDQNSIQQVNPVSDQDFIELDELMRMFQIVIEEKEALIKDKQIIFEQKNALQQENNELKEELKQLKSKYNIEMTQLQHEKDTIQNQNMQLQQIQNQQYDESIQNIFKAQQLQAQEQYVSIFLTNLKSRLDSAKTFVEKISFSILISELEKRQHLDVCHSFSIYNEYDAQNIAQEIQFSHQFWPSQPVKSLVSLNATITAIKVVGFGGIQLYFDEQFMTSTIEEDVWKRIFQQHNWIGGIYGDLDSPAYESLIILYNIDMDEIVIKPYLTEQFFQQNDNILFDAIIDTNGNITQLERLKIRKLIITQRSNKTSFNLHYPSFLESISLCGAEINNLINCTNLTVYSSSDNNINYDTLKQLGKINIFNSYDDIYQGQTKKSSILLDILDLTKPEIVWIQPKQQILNIHFETKIPQLKQLIYRELNQKFKLNIDVSLQQPQSLKFIDAGAGKYTFSGNKYDVKTVQDQLIQLL